jgi:hypothetical protein
VQFVFHTMLGRFAVLVLSAAVMVGVIWSWRTSPKYFISAQYFITHNPQETVAQRDGKPFNMGSDYHRSLLVSGTWPMPFGVLPDINVRLIQHDSEIDSQLAKSEASDYSRNCGFPLEQGKPRVSWRGTRLCNTGDLDGDLWQAAVQLFHDKVDHEISQYRWRLAMNAGEKIGKSLLAAFALIVLLAAGLWVARGQLT